MRQHPTNEMMTCINSNNKKEEKPMGAVSAFTTGNNHCKPLMTDVVLIHKNKVKKNMTLQPMSMTHQAYAPFREEMTCLWKV